VDSNYNGEVLEEIFLNYIDRETLDRIDYSLGLRFTLYLEEKEEQE